MDAHDDYLMYLDHEETEQTPERFVIDTDSRATWALRKMAQLEARQAERQRFVDAEIARLKAWQAREDQKAQRFMEYLISLLRTYYDHLKTLGVVTEKNKSYKLPHGVLSARTAPIEWSRDDAKLLPQVKTLGLIRVREEIDWATLKDRLVPLTEDGQIGVAGVDRETGTIFEGVIVNQPVREVFKVTTNPD